MLQNDYMTFLFRSIQSTLLIFGCVKKFQTFCTYDPCYIYYLPYTLSFNLEKIQRFLLLSKTQKKRSKSGNFSDTLYIFILCTLRSCRGRFYLFNDGHSCTRGSRDRRREACARITKLIRKSERD